MRLVNGNGCGHDPNNPNFELVTPIKTGKGGLPRVLTLCMERLRDYYYRPRKLIPSLDLANGSERQQRSERREACVNLLNALLRRTDLTSLRVGVPTPDGFMNYTVEYITKDTGMTLRRAERALHDLKAAGLITVAPRCQAQPDGSWKGLAAVKAISKHLFGAFGLESMLAKERSKSSKRLKRKAQEWERATNDKPQTRTGKARLRLFMGKLRGDLDNSPRKRSRPRATDPPDDIEHRKQHMLATLELKEANPDWSSAKCNEEATRLLAEGLFVRR